MTEATTYFSVGPIQLIVFGFGADAEFRGEILAELESLVARGLIRLIDLQFVMKEEDGGITALEMSSLTEAEAIEFGTVIGGLIGLGRGGEGGQELGELTGAVAAAQGDFGLGLEDLQGVADELQPGESTALLMFEHTWAARLRDAIRRAGGFPIMQGFLTPEVLLMMGAEIEAIVEAEQMIEVADAVKNAAILDALITVDAAEYAKTVAVAEALDTLITAGLIEDMAADRALNALTTAGLIEEAAYADALAHLAAVEAEIELAMADVEESDSDGAELT